MARLMTAAWFLAVVAGSGAGYAQEGGEMALRAAVAKRAMQGGAAPAPVEPTKIDLEAREWFLKVERFARLTKEEQGKGLEKFYREVARVNSMPLLILSTVPERLLDQEAPRGEKGRPVEERWTEELDEAAKTLTPEEVADKLGTRMWYDLGIMVRSKEVLRGHEKEVAVLVGKDLESKDAKEFMRGCTMVAELKLARFVEQMVGFVLEDGEREKAAYGAMVWMEDPTMLPAMMGAVKKDAKNVIRLGDLMEGQLAGEKAPAELVALLESKDAEVRFGAATALQQCKDEDLVQPMLLLSQEKEARFQLVALEMGKNLTDAQFSAPRNGRFVSVDSELGKLLDSPIQEVQVAAVGCFAKHKNAAAGPALLKLLKLPKMDPAMDWRVMQAFSTLTGDTMGYDPRAWGPEKNGKAIARFEAWVAREKKVEIP